MFCLCHHLGENELRLEGSNSSLTLVNLISVSSTTNMDCKSRELVLVLRLSFIRRRP